MFRKSLKTSCFNEIKNHKYPIGGQKLPLNKVSKSLVQFFNGMNINDLVTQQHGS